MATPTDPKARIIADPPHFVPRRVGDSPLRLATRDAARVDSSKPSAGFSACPFPPDFSHSSH
jgi:hypothetical protein